MPTDIGVFIALFLGTFLGNRYANRSIDWTKAYRHYRNMTAKRQLGELHEGDLVIWEHPRHKLPHYAGQILEVRYDSVYIKVLNFRRPGVSETTVPYWGLKRQPDEDETNGDPVENAS